MARIGVLASGSGTNFEKIALSLQGTVHQTAVLLCDRREAFCFQRAQKLGIPGVYVPYSKTAGREEAEQRLTAELERHGVDLVVLAGFMKILTPWFVRRWSGRLVNIHPALLPRHPGAHGIAESFHSGDLDLGVTVHLVDEGVDTGPILGQRSFERTPGLTLEQAEQKIHDLEYRLYPEVILRLLDSIDKEK